MNTNQQYSFRSSGDFRVRKSSSSRGSRFTRRLSEDLFITPQSAEPKTITELSQAENNATIQAPSTSQAEVTTQKEQQTKRFGLFRRLKEENKNKKLTKPKFQVPKILIQDFSNEREIEQVKEVERKLTSRERRRQQREQKRREKERQHLEEECRRNQSVHAQSQKEKVQFGDAGSQPKSETSYGDVYF
ncbi:hypothetical protein WMY93_008987 [Mugilogobius chulae]|uniref:Uncharacterized protein n=1 Tax=Mugilogobius chulae TaxID=88201 RepID=A0AAW0PKR7_9GOBI